jgi:hypothetical protein
VASGPDGGERRALEWRQVGVRALDRPMPSVRLVPRTCTARSRLRAMSALAAYSRTKLTHSLSATVCPGAVCRRKRPADLPL